MRLLFVGTDLRLASALTEGYSDVEVVAVISSWSDALTAAQQGGEERPLSCVILSAELSSPIDRAARTRT